jgi:LysM repeat protein
VKIRRRGRHAAPSQVEQLAGKAVVAAPAVVVAGGVIMGGASSASAAVTPNASVSASAHGVGASASGKGAQVSAKRAHAAVQTARTQTVHATLDAATSSSGQSYTVQSGDTLASIAGKFLGAAGDWQKIADLNSSLLSNPNLIFPGQSLEIPSGSSSASSSAPSTSSSASSTSSDSSSDASTTSETTSSASSSSSGSGSSGYSGSESGTLGCSGLENLWEQAGGSASEAHMAAEIAMAESGGNQYAHSPTDDYGYWQINGSHGSEATYDPIGNAKAAISISGDGTDWSQWSTYSSGAYAGK